MESFSARPVKVQQGVFRYLTGKFCYRFETHNTPFILLQPPASVFFFFRQVLLVSHQLKTSEFYLSFLIQGSCIVKLNVSWFNKFVCPTENFLEDHRILELHCFTLFFFFPCTFFDYISSLRALNVGNSCTLFCLDEEWEGVSFN